MMKFDCGCVNEVDDRWGVQCCVFKCDFHANFLANQQLKSLAHYEEMGAIINGVPQHRRYIEEFLEPMQEVRLIVPEGGGAAALEIGCGLGMYAPLFLQRGYSYRGLEPVAVAADWTRNTFNVPVYEQRFEEFTGSGYAAIMAAHIFEHLKDAPIAIQQTYDMLNPGGALYVVSPDDSDPLNPDHLWFFNCDTLRTVLEGVGFANVRMVSRKRIERENFIYCVAEKL